MADYVLTENGNIKVKDGKPLVKDGEKEYTIDALGAQQRITDLSAESKGHRTKASERKKALAKFEGIADPAAAITALATVETMGDDHKVDMDKLKTSMTDAWQKKVTDLETKNEGLTGDLFTANVTGKIAASPIIKTTVLPADIFVNTFKKNFKADGSAVDDQGNVILSKENPSVNAGVDEALGVLIANRSDRDSILRATSGGSGSGDAGGGGGGPELSSQDNIKAGLAKL